MEQPTLYSEPGASWWPLLWGPAFGLAGFLLEALTGAAHAGLWAAVAAGLFLPTLLWVQARRRLYEVRLTPVALHQGREELQLRDIAEVEGVEPRAGARVLGGGWTLPRGRAEVPIKLVDGMVVVGWARDPEALGTALGELLRRRPLA
ncbi:hypothetical protein JOF41_005692 [Saccharothrix coeruleofusca]|uniref:hypothetical protein n=1 Tax=Saccharothrix coeruleofusca TaxID=33919 RepID=UPI001AE7FF20|nr:hypothetical protein [Saccharothrix coeruleofusca]MBP2339514.1 hypothetical protein [Saccharothrix coeruleofusca]